MIIAVDWDVNNQTNHLKVGTPEAATVFIPVYHPSRWVRASLPSLRCVLEQEH